MEWNGRELVPALHQLVDVEFALRLPLRTVSYPVGRCDAVRGGLAKNLARHCRANFL